MELVRAVLTFLGVLTAVGLVYDGVERLLRRMRRRHATPNDPAPGQWGIVLRSSGPRPIQVIKVLREYGASFEAAAEATKNTQERIFLDLRLAEAAVLALSESLERVGAIGEVRWGSAPDPGAVS
jgi:hypothetical protein